MIILEGVRVSQSILKKVLDAADDINMGFEAEFHAESYDLSSEREEIDFSHTSLSDATEYFENTGSLDYDDMYDYAKEHDIDDDEYLHHGYDEDQATQDFIEGYFDYEDNWYMEYLDEKGKWDHDKEEPKIGGDGEDIARKNIVDDLEQNRLGYSDYSDLDDYLDRERRERVNNDWLADAVWEYSWSDFVEINEWEHTLEESELDSDIFISSSEGGMQEIAELFSNETGYDEPTVFTEYHASDKDTDEWYLEPDSSVSDGAELVSPVFSFHVGLEALEKTFNWMTGNQFTTSESTGLHISLSFDEEPDEVDWVKVAVLMGEKHMLEQFERMHNTYTKSQLEQIENYAKKNDLIRFKKWNGFKELTHNLGKAISQDKSNTFNIGNFANSGRIEFRIMGNDGYEDRFEEVKENILKFIMFMKIATDENLFKKEYMQKIGKILNAGKKDALQPETLDTTAEIKDDPFYRITQQIFRGNKEALQAITWVITEYKRASEKDSEDLKAIHRNTGLTYIMILAKQAIDVSRDYYGSLFEAKDSKVNAARSFIRRLALTYGVTKEEVEEYIKNDPDVGMSSYVPIADDITGRGHIGNQVAMLFPDYDSKHTETKKWILDRISNLRAMESGTRGVALGLLSNNTVHGYADPNRLKSENINSLYELVKRATTKHPDSEKVKQFVVDLMEFKGITPADLKEKKFTPGELSYMGIASQDEIDAGHKELQRRAWVNEITELHKHALSSLTRQDTIAYMFNWLTSPDPEELANGETQLLKLMWLYMDDSGRQPRPGHAPNVFKSLFELAVEFEPGNSIPTANVEMINQLQEWYGVEWFAGPLEARQPKEDPLAQALAAKEEELKKAYQRYADPLGVIVGAQFVEDMLKDLSASKTEQRHEFHKGLAMLASTLFRYMESVKRLMHSSGDDVRSNPRWQAGFMALVELYGRYGGHIDEGHFQHSDLFDEVDQFYG